MKIKTNATDRKLLAGLLAEKLNTDFRYLGVPSFAYVVGGYTINKDATITGDDLSPILNILLEHNYIQPEDIPQEEKPIDSAATAVEPNEINETCISIPASEFTPSTAMNLIRLVYARQDLINAMTQGEKIYIDSEMINRLNDEKPETLDHIRKILISEKMLGLVLGISFEEDKFMLEFPSNPEEPDKWLYYARLMEALVDRAKKAGHVNAKRILPKETEMKYYCHGFLMQLGMGGPDHKETRQVLLGHLKGFAAFRTSEQMEAHKAKFSERRRNARTANLEATSAEKQEEVVG